MGRKRSKKMKKLVKMTRCLQFAFALLLTVGLVAVFATTTKAAAPKPAGVKQVDATESSVKITWNTIMADKAYLWYKISDTQDMANFRKGRIGRSNTDTNETINGLSAGCSYYVSVGATENSAYSTMPSDVVWSDTIEVVTAPEDMANDAISFNGATETSISLSWTPVAGANSYRVYYVDESNNSDNGVSVTTNSNSITLTGLKKNSEYKVQVYPQKISAAGYTAEYSANYGSKRYVPTLPTKIEGVDCDYFNPSVKKGYAQFSWNKNTNADGYSYEIYAYNGKKALIKGQTDGYNYDYVTVENKKLKTRKMYKIRVRAYINTSSNQKVYGAWSSYNYFCRSVGDDISMKKNGSKVKLSWKKVTGATGYTVYMASTKGYGSNRTFKKVGTTKKNTYTVNKKFKKGYDYYFRIVPKYKKGKVTGGGVVNSTTSYAGYLWISSSSGKWYFSKY